GYCAIGIEYSASAPAIVVTMAMTTASRGRSTKMADSIASSSLVEDRLKRGSVHWRAGAHGLESLHDDLLVALEPGLDGDTGAHVPQGLDPFHDCLAVLHDKQVDTLLVRNEGGLRHHDLLLDAAAFQIHPHLHELTIDEGGLRIGEN